MILRPPRSTLTATLVTYTTLCRAVSESARGLGLRARPPQHPANIGILVERHRGSVGRARERRLDTFGGKALRLLRRALAELDALAAVHPAPIVHHPQHLAPAPHFFADTLPTAFHIIPIYLTLGSSADRHIRKGGVL